MRSSSCCRRKAAALAALCFTTSFWCFSSRSFSSSSSITSSSLRRNFRASLHGVVRLTRRTDAPEELPLLALRWSAWSAVLGIFEWFEHELSDLQAESGRLVLNVQSASPQFGCNRDLGLSDFVFVMSCSAFPRSAHISVWRLCWAPALIIRTWWWGAPGGGQVAFVSSLGLPPGTPARGLLPPRMGRQLRAQQSIPEGSGSSSILQSSESRSSCTSWPTKHMAMWDRRTFSVASAAKGQDFLSMCRL
mmetsp:Transcript_67931/g.191483  ORF Transcript_67931/g.191483 Transcript_67931/m.191483 type:complete len:248 (-) Transcript_67931:137-880(-)